ncbi:PR domain zinc finger protein 5-like [Argonauta hians]
MEKDLNDSIDQNEFPEQASFTIVSVPSDYFQDGQIPWTNLPSANLSLETVSGLEQYDIPQRVVVETLIPFSEHSVNSTLIRFKEDAARIESTLENIANDLQEQTNSSEEGEIFSHLTGVISSSVMQAIPQNKQTIFDKFQSKYQMSVDMSAEGTCVSGSFSALTQLEKALRHLLLPEYSSSNESNVDLKVNCHKETLMRPDMVDKEVSCNLLQPHISLHGRQVRQHPRYTSYVNSLGSSNEDQNQNCIRKRGRPRKRQLVPKDNVKLKTNEQQTFNESQARNVDSNENSLDAALEDCHQQSENLSFDETLLNDQEDKDLQTKVPSPAKMYLNKGRQSTVTSRGLKKKNYEALAPFKFFCSECSFKSKRESHFVKHIKLHEKDNKLYQCQQCDFTSIRLSHLRRHELLHSTTLLHCVKCQYSTDSNKLLARHVKNRHSTQRHTLRYSCPKCQYKTLRWRLYCSHLRVSHNETCSNTSSATAIKLCKSYQCDLCSYKSQRKEHYVRHRNNVHCNQRPYLCDLCGKAFKRPDALAQHKFTHLDKSARLLPFTCTLCSKAFRSQAHLTEHQTMHSNIRAHLCHYCGASFKTRSVQQKHIQSIHVNPRSYNCLLCTKRFNTNYALMRHKRTHDGSDVGCEGHKHDEANVVCGEHKGSDGVCGGQKHDDSHVVCVGQKVSNDDSDVVCVDHKATNDDSNVVCVMAHMESSCSSLQQVQSFSHDSSACQQVLVQDVMSPLDVTYDPNIQQPLVHTNETTAALLYLTNNLPPY